jgi:hypothetical protein
MFYLLAKNEDEEGIIRNREKYSINACDEKGHTAVDIALIKSEYKVAKLLNKCGGVINSRWRANARIVRCVDNVCKWYEDLSKEECEFLANTMEMGLSPEIEVSLNYDDQGLEVSPFERKYCTLFGAAIENAKYNVVDGEYVNVETKGDGKRTLLYDVQVRVNKDYRLEMHLDTDDANACGIGNQSKVKLVKVK